MSGVALSKWNWCVYDVAGGSLSRVDGYCARKHDAKRAAVSALRRLIAERRRGR